MPKPTTVVPTTPLGEALEKHREASGMSRAAASRAANCSPVQWQRLLQEERRFEPRVIARAALAVGMDLLEALRLAKVAVIPDDASRVLRLSEVLQLRDAS